MITEVNFHRGYISMVDGGLSINQENNVYRHINGILPKAVLVEGSPVANVKNSFQIGAYYDYNNEQFVPKSAGCYPATFIREVSPITNDNNIKHNLLLLRIGGYTESILMDDETVTTHYTIVMIGPFFWKINKTILLRSIEKVSWELSDDNVPLVLGYSNNEVIFEAVPACRRDLRLAIP